MKHIAARFLFCAAVLTLGLSPAHAEEEGPPLSYSMKNPDGEMAESVSTLLEWAKGEVEEHDGEGLFKKHPADRVLIMDMLTLAKELQAKAAAAQKAGDAAQARLNYHAAEAIANYAARMPHMLEHRAK